MQKIIHPTGGPKDTTPPKLINSFPLQGSTGFKGKKIKLKFDKEVDVQCIYDQLIINPSIDAIKESHGYTYKVMGDTLTITLDQFLHPKTTYTFNFCDAIIDMTERNVMRNPIITFSTGEQIDSMYVTGQVGYLMTKKVAPNSFVMLYNNEDPDRNIINSPPDYIVKTDEKGSFKIDHIKKGKYRIYASNGKTNEHKVDTSVREYGFLSYPIDLTMESLDNVNILITKADVGSVVKNGVELNSNESEKQSEPSGYTFTPKSGSEVPADFVATMTFTKPIETVDSYQFVITNSEKIEALNPEEISLNDNKNVLTLKKHFDSNLGSGQNTQEFTLRIDEGAVITTDGETNSQILNKYKIKAPNEYGTIKGTVNVRTNGFILQLLDLDYNVVDEIKNKKEYQFNLVAPGDYRLRLLCLADKEAVWRPGNILKNIQPDPVIVYPHVVSVVANWEIRDMDFN